MVFKTRKWISRSYPRNTNIPHHFSRVRMQHSSDHCCTEGKLYECFCLPHLCTDSSEPEDSYHRRVLPTHDPALPPSPPPRGTAARPPPLHRCGGWNPGESEEFSVKGRSQHGHKRESSVDALWCKDSAHNQLFQIKRRFQISAKSCLDRVFPAAALLKHTGFPLGFQLERTHQS